MVLLSGWAHRPSRQSSPLPCPRCSWPSVLRPLLLTLYDSVRGRCLRSLASAKVIACQLLPRCCTHESGQSSEMLVPAHQELLGVPAPSADPYAKRPPQSCPKQSMRGHPPAQRNLGL